MDHLAGFLKNAFKEWTERNKKDVKKMIAKILKYQLS